MSHLHKDPCIFMIISRSTFLGMSSVSDKSCIKIKTHFMFNNIFLPEIGAVNEAMWKHSVDPNRSHMTI